MYYTYYLSIVCIIQIQVSMCVCYQNMISSLPAFECSCIWRYCGGKTWCGKPNNKPSMMVILGMVLDGLYSVYHITVLGQKTLQDRRELLRPCWTLHTWTKSMESMNQTPWHALTSASAWGWCKDGSWTIFLKIVLATKAWLASWSLLSWPTRVARTDNIMTWSPPSAWGWYDLHTFGNLFSVCM